MAVRQLREVFLKQPAYFVFLDASLPMEIQTFNNICETLTNVTALIAGIRGCKRISALCVYYLAENVHCIFPPQDLKPNFSRLCSFLECAKHARSSVDICDACSAEKLEVCVNKSFKQHKLFFERVKEEDRPLLHFIMFTSQPFGKLRTMAEKALAKSDYRRLRKFEVFYIPPRSHLPGYELLEDDTHPENSSSNLASQLSLSQTPKSEESIPDSDIIKSLISISLIANNVYEFERIFKSMLYNFTTDADHMRIVIDGEDYVVHCDMYERALNTYCLIGAQTFNLAHETCFMDLLTSNLSKTGSGKAIRYLMNIIGIIRKWGICESLTFGPPVIIGPTRCWKYEWDYLEKNQQRFRALNQYLRENDVVLLVKSHDFPGGCDQETVAHPIFIIFPSPKDNSMLVKSVVCREILVPLTDTILSGASNDVPLEILVQTKRMMEQYNVQNQLNPVFTSSGMYESLTTIQRKIREPTQAEVRSLTNQMLGLPQSTNHGAPVGISGDVIRRQGDYQAGSDRNRLATEISKKPMEVGGNTTPRKRDFVPRFVSAASMLERKT